MDSRMLTTAFGLEGWRIVKHYGIVRGISVRSRSIIGSFIGGLQTIVGGNISMFQELCEKTRREAFDVMMQHAEEAGANAVIGVRYDANEILQGVTEVLCYGTAVGIEKISHEDTRGEVGAEDLVKD